MFYFIFFCEQFTNFFFLCLLLRRREKNYLFVMSHKHCNCLQVLVFILLIFLRFSYSFIFSPHSFCLVLVFNVLFLMIINRLLHASLKPFIECSFLLLLFIFFFDSFFIFSLPSLFSYYRI